MVRLLLNQCRSLPGSTIGRICLRNKSSKVRANVLDCLEGLEDGMTVSFGGFGTCGIPEHLIQGIKQKGIQGLTAVSNDVGKEGFGLGHLLDSRQLAKIHASYVGDYKGLPAMVSRGEIELHLHPQGTLAEKLRAAGAGIPAFFTPAGVGTVVEHGFPVKYNSGEVEKVSQPKETQSFNGRKFVLEEALHADFACIQGYKADKAGNVVFRATSRNFNPDCAKAAKIAIVEVEEIVETGELHPDDIHLPGIYIDRVVKGNNFERRIEKLRHSHPVGQNTPRIFTTRDSIAKRAGQELKDGMYVNLGIGIPTVVSNHIPEGVNVTLQSENGLLGMGPYPRPGEEDPELINAGKETITYLPGSSTFSSSESFAMIRGRHIDLTILGALQVSAGGDLASWVIPGKKMKGMGGAMDLVAACERVIVAISHTDKHGHPKILSECTLPLTGKGVVDMIITELAVFKCDRSHSGGLTLLEIADDVTLEELRDKTGAPFKVSAELKVVHR